MTFSTRRELLKMGCVIALASVDAASVANLKNLWAAEVARLVGVANADESSKQAGTSVRAESSRDFALKILAKKTRGTESYTQGLVFETDLETGRDVLYESGGQYGRSLLRKIDVETGKILKKIDIPSQFFAEGIAVVGTRLFLLTWQERRCLVFDKKTFEKIDEFRYAGEGWGLAFDGRSLAMSDGTAKIRFLDPENFKLNRIINVFFIDVNGKKRPVHSLNELEFVEGELWANVYQQKYILRIDPNSGRVVKAIDFSTLVPENLKTSQEFVLNGIAYNPAKKTLFVTGKCWPVWYEISATPK